MSELLVNIPISPLELFGEPQEASRHEHGNSVFAAYLFLDGRMSVLESTPVDALPARIALEGQNPAFCETVRNGGVPSGRGSATCHVIAPGTLPYQRLLALAHERGRSLFDGEVQLSPQVVCGTLLPTVLRHALGPFHPSRAIFVARKSSVFFAGGIGVCNLAENDPHEPRLASHHDMFLRPDCASYHPINAILDTNRAFIRAATGRSSTAR